LKTVRAWKQYTVPPALSPKLGPRKTDINSRLN